MTDNVKHFPRYNLADIPACLEKVADDIRSGRTKVNTLLITTYTEERHGDREIEAWYDYKIFGRMLSKVEAIGLLEATKEQIWGNMQLDCDDG